MDDYRNLLNALMMQQRRRYAVGGAVAPAAASGVPLAGAGTPVPTPTQSQAMPSWLNNQSVMNSFMSPYQGPAAPVAQIATPLTGPASQEARNALQSSMQQFQQAAPNMASPTPTQPGFPSRPGFMPQQGMPQGGMFGQGFPQGAPMGGLNLFSQYNPMKSWRDARPEHQRGMDHDQFRQQMEAWRAQRPNFSAMPQPSSSPFSNAMPSDGPNYRPVEQNLTPSQQAAMEQERLRQDTYQSQNNYFAPSAEQLALNSAMYGNNSQPSGTSINSMPSIMASMFRG